MAEPVGKALRVQLLWKSPLLVLVPALGGVFLIMLTSALRSPAATFVAVAAMITGILATMANILAWVTVGGDGILVRRLFSRRSLAFSEIAEVREVDGELLRLPLRSGDTSDLFTHQDQNASKEEYQRNCGELYARIRLGIARHRDDGGHAERAEAVVARVGAPAAPGYRVAAAPTAEELLRVAADTGASATARARAAVAMRRVTDTTGRGKLLRIAEDTAEPELADALRAAAEAESEAEVEAALARVDAREPVD